MMSVVCQLARCVLRGRYLSGFQPGVFLSVCPTLRGWVGGGFRNSGWGLKAPEKKIALLLGGWVAGWVGGWGLAPPPPRGGGTFLGPWGFQKSVAGGSLKSPPQPPPPPRVVKENAVPTAHARPIPQSFVVQNPTHDPNPNPNPNQD